LTLPNVAGDPTIVDLTGGSLGLFTLTFSSGAGFRFSRTSPSPPIAPFDADIGLSVNIIDADGIASTSNPLVFGSAPVTAGNGILFNGVGSTPKQMRFGRLTLSNAFGSNLLDLPVPMETQYYTSGGIYKTNAEDNCTSILPSNVFLSTGAATGGGPLLKGKVNLNITKSGSPVSIDLCVDLDGTPPSDGSCVAATPANMPWLQWKWTGSTFDKDPRAKATFGLFKSADEFIYLREMF
jgi:MSHA biogenesis protein MshQ